MKIKFKICGMREPENISQIIQYKPDFIGFIFYERSPRYAGDHLAEINKVLIPEHIHKVGVFVNEDLDKILQVREILPFDIVQLHGDEPVSLCDELKQQGITVIKVFSVGENFDFGVMMPYHEYVDFFLFDTKGVYYGGNSTPFNWKLIADYPFKVPFFLGGGIGNENIYEIRNLGNTFLYAVDANSQLESSPGTKDMSKVRLFRQRIDEINL